ncbi:MAG: hypothetical protein GEU80_07940 [Dehalococcoidia bacterium]|nr:hypothetical protein [Dehalococcoidia bacterium]
MFARILTTLDGSEYAERALKFTRDLAGIGDAQVNLLTVIPTMRSAGASADPPPDERRGKAALAYLEEHAGALRAEVQSEVVTHVRFGDPARETTDLARELDADLVVMSTQGLGADGSYALGSVALKVLMTAPCPVFMVRINKPEPPRSVAEERWQGEGGANVG